MLHLSQPRFRVDFARRMHRSQDDRPPDQLLAHYALERQLSDRLRRVPRELLVPFYILIYGRLSRAVRIASRPPPMPLNATRLRGHPRAMAAGLSNKFDRSSYLWKSGGDAALAFAAARHVRTVYRVDVTDTLNRYCYSATEFCILAYKWNRNSVGSRMVDFGYSNQLLETSAPRRMLRINPRRSTAFSSPVVGICA